MLRPPIATLVCILALALAAQEGPQQQTDSKVSVPRKNTPPPRSDQDDSKTQEGEYSSSKTYKIDIAPPSGEGRPANSQDSDDINELKPWNPHKAMKAVEVGDYYRKQKKYAAAESRYREALQYKPNDAMASFRLAQTLEKMGRGDEAVTYYEAYLKILPEGEFAKDCHKGIARISKTARKQ